MVKKRDASQPKKGGGAWKNSPLVGVALGVVIIACLSYVGYCFYGPVNNDSALPENYPHAFLAEKDNGNYDAILVKRGRRDAPTPFTENGKEYWPAYICSNPDCPGRKNGKPYIFAAVMRPPAEETAPPTAPDAPDAPTSTTVCPKCKEAMDKAKGANRSRYDLTAVERYNTPEGLEIIKKIREDYHKNNPG